jgi:hypothetical protein
MVDVWAKAKGGVKLTLVPPGPSPDPTTSSACVWSEVEEVATILSPKA